MIKLLQVLILFLFAGHSLAHGQSLSANSQTTNTVASPFRTELYSETLYDARIRGAVTDTRIRFLRPFLKNTLKPFLGFHFSRDLTNGSAPQAIQNALSPSLGVTYQLPLWFSFITEKRFNYLSNHPTGLKQNEEFRYGLIGYEKLQLSHGFYNETYGEIIAIDRVSNQAVFTIFNKFGWNWINQSKSRFGFYVEPFSRQSPDLNYGPTENELRLGTQWFYHISPFSIRILVNHSLYSNTRPGGWDTLLVISGGGW